MVIYANQTLRIAHKAMSVLLKKLKNASSLNDVDEEISFFENDEQINEVFNQKFIRTIAAIRRVENQAYLKVISSWEREYLLLNV